MSARLVFRALFLAACLAGTPASAMELSVGLFVPAGQACGAGGCLQIVVGRYHPATITGASPDARDRRTCEAGFARLIAAMSEGRPVARQVVYRARRCRSLGLAPVIVRG